MGQLTSTFTAVYCLIIDFCLFSFLFYKMLPYFTFCFCCFFTSTVYSFTVLWVTWLHADKWLSSFSCLLWCCYSFYTHVIWQSTNCIMALLHPEFYFFTIKIFFEIFFVLVFSQLLYFKMGILQKWKHVSLSQSCIRHYALTALLFRYICSHLRKYPISQAHDSNSTHLGM